MAQRMEAGLERSRKHGRWARGVLGAAILGFLVTGGVAIGRRITSGREGSPVADWTAKAPAQARLLAGTSGVAAVWSAGDSVRVLRLPGGQSADLAPADATVAMGDGVIVAADASAGALKYVAVEGGGIPAAGTLRTPGIVAGTGDASGFIVVAVDAVRGAGAESPDSGGSLAGGSFSVRRLDTRGRVVWEKRFEGVPLMTRAWQGLAVVAALHVGEYPFTTMLAVRGNSCLEYKAIPGLVRGVELYREAGLLVSLGGTCVYAHDSAGRLAWSVEPGGVPADAAACDRGVVVVVEREARGALHRLFARDFAALYDKDGARLWKTDVPPGASCVAICGETALVGSAAGVTAIDTSGSIRWQVKTPAPVRAIEAADGGDRFYALTEAGEISAYSIGRQAGDS